MTEETKNKALELRTQMESVETELEYMMNNLAVERAIYDKIVGRLKTRIRELEVEMKVLTGKSYLPYTKSLKQLEAEDNGQVSLIL